MHVGSNPTGIWLSYFENGKLSTFNYFEIIHDSSFIIYEKKYLNTGSLESSILPIKVDITKGPFIIGRTYDLKIELEYSEFDSVNSIVFFDKNLKVKFDQDSIFSTSNIVKTKFKPIDTGDIMISGTYAELGAEIDYTNEKMIAEKPFKVKIHVVKQ